MKAFDREVLARLPLAEAVLVLFGHVLSPERLQDLFAEHRGRSYEKVLSFPQLVSLVRDALLQHQGSARQSILRAQEAGALDVVPAAVYDKLGRLPLGLSQAFLREATANLQDLLEVPPSPPPTCLAGVACVILDGKAIKHLPHRRKATRAVKDQLLGGKLAVALAMNQRLAVALQATENGQRNEVILVPALVGQVRQVVPGPRLWVGDRQYCDLNLLALCTAEADHFLIRYSRNLGFHPDPTRCPQEGRDAQGRRYVQEWGWVGEPTDPRRRYVRKLTLLRPEAPGQDVSLLTDLLDETRHPAVDLLQVYLGRWGIEQVFQQITELYHLRRLIGTTPAGTVFQAAFCLLIHNLIQVIQAYVAQGAGQPTARVSTAQLLGDGTEELIAWSKLGSVAATVGSVERFRSAAQVRRRLHQLLDHQWTDRWLKAPPSRHRVTHRRRHTAAGHIAIAKLLDARPRPGRQPSVRQRE